MPNFNYGTAFNIHGQTLESTEDRLFDFVRETFVRRGTESIHLKDCREAGFHEDILSRFQNEDELIDATVQDLIQKIKMNYDAMTEEARAYLDGRVYTEDQSYQKLERLLNRHIWLVFNPKNRSYVLMASNEVMLKEPHQKAIAKAIQEHFTKILYHLILTAGQIKNERWAALLATSAISSIHVFVQQPELCKCIYQEATRQDPNYSEIQDYVNNMILRNIYMNLGINKPF